MLSSEFEMVITSPSFQPSFACSARGVNVALRRAKDGADRRRE
jgi:hypothetical protein